MIDGTDVDDSISQITQSDPLQQFPCIGMLRLVDCQNDGKIAQLIRVFFKEVCENVQILVRIVASQCKELLRGCIEAVF